jgi:hypothetical protein
LGKPQRDFGITARRRGALAPGNNPIPNTGLGTENLQFCGCSLLRFDQRLADLLLDPGSLPLCALSFTHFPLLSALTLLVVCALSFTHFSLLGALTRLLVFVIGLRLRRSCRARVFRRCLCPSEAGSREKHEGGDAGQEGVPLIHFSTISSLWHKRSDVVLLDKRSLDGFGSVK